MAGVGINLLSKLKAKRSDRGFDYEWGSTEILQNAKLEALSRSELRNHLDARDLDISGNKKAMVRRLEADLEAERLRGMAYSEHLEAEFVISKDIEERGSVYAVGSNFAGQLGLGDAEPRRWFTVVPKTRGIGVVEVAVNRDMCFAVTADHEVLVWGGNGTGATGIIPDDDEEWKDDYFTEPQFVHELDGEEVSAVCLGASHSAALTTGGDVFVWGHNNCGQLGLAHLETRRQPKLVPFFEQDPSLHVHQIASGENHAAALTTEGRVYCWGHVDAGKLGIGVDERYGARAEERFFFPAPTLVSKLSKSCIRQIACGSAHTLARSSEGRVFAWGHGAGGRLGMGDCADRIEPEPIPELERLCVLQIAASTWTSAAIVLYPPLLDTGWVYTWGSGYHGQLGHGSIQVQSTPAPVLSLMQRQLSAKSIAMGSHHCAMIAVDGELYTWGSNTDGCLGHSISEKYVQYTPEPGLVSGFGAIVERVGRGMVRSYACGREFTIVATYPYEGPSEEVAMKLMEDERIRSSMQRFEDEHEHEKTTDRDTQENAASSALESASSGQHGLLTAGHDESHTDTVTKILEKGMRSAKLKQTR